VNSHRRHLLTATVLAGALPRLAVAQAWPDKPIRLVVPYSVGGAPDVLARLLAQEMGPTLGAIVVENRSGAGGNVGAGVVAKSPGDGYTFLVTTAATHAINPALYPSMPYDPVRDFSPVTLIASTPLIFVTAATSPFKSVAEVAAYARANPKQLTYASAGAGTMQHIAGELFEDIGKLEMTHVPYRGSGQVMPDLASGRVGIMFNSIAAVSAMLREGRLRALAVTTPKRLASWPDVPTMGEAGLPGFEASAWYAVFGPAGVPAPIVDRLAREIHKVLDAPLAKERYAALGLEPLRSTPKELGDTVQRDLVKWTRFLKERNIKLDG
jgi:tripartite-type tricarboxylate transporter receptor subunit TctC